MQLYTVIHAEPNRGNVDKVVDILMNELGLVVARSSELCLDEIRAERELLVWEDSQGIGRYRVHIFENNYDDKTKRYSDSFSFTYWDSRLTPEIVREDPMRQSIERTKQIIHGKYIEEIRTDIPDERILRLIV